MSDDAGFRLTPILRRILGWRGVRLATELNHHVRGSTSLVGPGRRGITLAGAGCASPYRIRRWMRSDRWPAPPSTSYIARGSRGHEIRESSGPGRSSLTAATPSCRFAPFTDGGTSTSATMLWCATRLTQWPRRTAAPVIVSACWEPTTSVSNRTRGSSTHLITPIIHFLPKPWQTTLAPELHRLGTHNPALAGRSRPVPRRDTAPDF